jgi:hypothetical protein
VIAAAWLWAVAGVAFVFVAGIVLALALGLITMPGDLLRRAG